MLFVWAADSGAYFVGKATGKRKLSPLVSPNKTVEGFVGGIIFSLLTLISFMVLFNETHQSMHDNYLGYIALSRAITDLVIVSRNSLKNFIIAFLIKAQSRLIKFYE